MRLARDHTANPVRKLRKRISKKAVKRRLCVNELTREHVAELTFQETLTKQVGMSL